MTHHRLCDPDPPYDNNIYLSGANPTEFLAYVRHNGEIIDPTSNIKENRMATKLLTPSETIERKDLIVALEVVSGDQNPDELMHAIALVQTLRPGEKIARGFRLKKSDVLNRVVTIVDEEITGICTDLVVPGDIQLRSNERQIVINGEIVLVARDAYVIVAQRASND